MIPRSLVVGAVVAVAVALAGCVATGPEPAATGTATSTGRPTPSGTPSSTSPPSPTGSPTPPSTASAEPDPSRDEELTADQAVEVCLERYESFGPAEFRATPSGAPRTYERHVQPHWLVLIPAVNINGSLYIECRLGGPYSDPHMRGVGEIAEFLVTDEYIQRAIDENEGL